MLFCATVCAANWEISWAKQDKAQYTLTYSKIGSNISTTVQLGENNKYIFKSPENNAKYTFQVSAHLNDIITVSDPISFSQKGDIKKLKPAKPQLTIKIQD